MNILEKTIFKALSKHAKSQINLESESARHTITREISSAIEKSFYPVMVRAARPLDDTLTVDMEDQFDY